MHLRPQPTELIAIQLLAGALSKATLILFVAYMFYGSLSTSQSIVNVYLGAPNRNELKVKLGEIVS